MMLNRLNLARGRVTASKNRSAKRAEFLKDTDAKNKGLLKFFTRTHLKNNV